LPGGLLIWVSGDRALMTLSEKKDVLDCHARIHPSSKALWQMETSLSFHHNGQ
jgi:hypothetical protein